MRVQVGIFFLVFFRDDVDDTVFYEGRAFDELYHWHSLRPLSDDYDRTKSDIKGTYWGDKPTSGQKTGAPNVNFRKISVRKTIWDLEFSEHFFKKFLACLPLLGFSNT